MIGDVARENVTVNTFPAVLPAVETLFWGIGLDRKSGSRNVRCMSTDSPGCSPPYPPVPRHVIHISSTSVYGQSAGEVVDEDSPCEPTQDNGRVCLDAERIALAYADEQTRVDTLRWRHLRAGPADRACGSPTRAATSRGQSRRLVESDACDDAARVVVELSRRVREGTPPDRPCGSSRTTVRCRDATSTPPSLG